MLLRSYRHSALRRPPPTRRKDGERQEHAYAVRLLAGGAFYPSGSHQQARACARRARLASARDRHPELYANPGRGHAHHARLVGLDCWSAASRPLYDVRHHSFRYRKRNAKPAKKAGNGHERSAVWGRMGGKGQHRDERYPGCAQPGIPGDVGGSSGRAYSDERTRKWEAGPAGTWK